LILTSLTTIISISIVKDVTEKHTGRLACSRERLAKASASSLAPQSYDSCRLVSIVSS
jgi:hypothetical protein